MVSRILDPATGMRLEIQLLNANNWLAYGRPNNPNATPLESFIDMITAGSDELDAIIVRNNCPYLFKIWSQPTFNVSEAALVKRAPQERSEFIRVLDENVVGVIFSYLTEEDLTKSVSSVCYAFRANIASAKHAEMLLGKAVSTEMRQLFARKRNRSKDSAQTLADRLVDMVSTINDAKQAFTAGSEIITREDPSVLSKVDSALINLFGSVDDCSKRLVLLAQGLTAKQTLEAEHKRIKKILHAVESISKPGTLAHHALLHLLGSTITYGWTFGTKPKLLTSATAAPGFMMAGAPLDDEAVNTRYHGFQFGCLKDLQEIKSRFHRPMTPSVAVLLHILERHMDGSPSSRAVFERGIRELNDALFILCGEMSGSVFQIMDSARSVVNRVRKASREAREFAAVVDEAVEGTRSFHLRLFHLFKLFEPLCVSLENSINRASDGLTALTSWLVPMRVDHEEQSIFVKIHGTNGELKSLAEFVQHCEKLITVPSTESVGAVRDLALAATALEQAAVARNASQKALFKLSSVASASSDVSGEFSSARSAVARTLDRSQAIAGVKDARRTQMMSEVLSVEEQEKRQTILQAALRLRFPEHEQSFHTDGGDVQEDTGAPGGGEQLEVGHQQPQIPESMADQIKARRTEQVDVESLEQDDEIVVEDVDDTQANTEEEDADLRMEQEAVANRSPASSPRDVTSTVLGHLSPSSIVATSPPSVVPMSPLGDALGSSLTPSGRIDSKTTKMWNWICFATEQMPSVWGEIHAGNSVYLIPVVDEEETLLSRLFSRGPEVALSVGQSHQKLKHFTSEDFSGARSFKRDQSASSLLDTERTKRAIEALPPVRLQQHSASFSYGSIGIAERRTSFWDGATSARSVVGRSSAAIAEENELITLQPLVATEDLSAEKLVLPLARIVELKKQGKLQSVGLRPENLENYLSDEEFETSFKMSRVSFSELAKWKRDKLKKDIGIF